MICAMRLASRIGCLFTHANHLESKPSYKDLYLCLFICIAITSFKSITMFSGIDSIIGNILHILICKYKEYSMKYYQSRITLLWIWIMLWQSEWNNNDCLSDIVVLNIHNGMGCRILEWGNLIAYSSAPIRAHFHVPGGRWKLLNDKLLHIFW